MSHEIKTTISKIDDNLQQQKNEENFNYIVEDLVNNDTFKSSSASNFITLIAKKYDISNENARNCLIEAIEQLDIKEPSVVEEEAEKEKPKEKLNGASEYFYKNSYTAKKPKDEMDSLCSLANYNRLMFNL